VSEKQKVVRVREICGHLVCETLEEVLEPSRCALLSVDIQNDAMHPEGKLAQAGLDISGMQEILPRCAGLIARARDFGVPVIHVRTEMAADGSSDSPAWLRAKGMMMGTPAYFVAGTWGAEISSECAPITGEAVITKTRSSAFVRSNLDEVLRNMGVETVVIIGEQTPGCIEATYRDAVYYDYYNVLVEDCVAAFNRELHEASLMIQRARHDVCESAEVIDIWARAAKRDAAVGTRAAW
jgi:nicotinamidase-related amidase